MTPGPSTSTECPQAAADRWGGSAAPADALAEDSVRAHADRGETPVIVDAQVAAVPSFAAGSTEGDVPGAGPGAAADAPYALGEDRLGTRATGLDGVGVRGACMSRA